MITLQEREREIELQVALAMDSVTETDNESSPKSTRPKSFLVPVIFEKDDEPPEPAKGVRVHVVQLLCVEGWHGIDGSTLACLYVCVYCTSQVLPPLPSPPSLPPSPVGEKCYACIVSKEEIPKLASALQVCAFIASACI